jgi:hypothetical protein
LKAYTDIHIRKGRLILDNLVDEFPPGPIHGEFCFKDGVLYIYAEIDGVATWYPLTNKAEYFVHEQEEPALEWEIDHGLKTQDIIFMVYDDEGVYQISGVEFVDDDNIIIKLTEPIAGKAVIFAAAGAYASGGRRGGGAPLVTETFVLMDGVTRTFAIADEPSGDVIVSLEGVSLYKNRDYTINERVITLDQEVYIEMDMYLSVTYN